MKSKFWLTLLSLSYLFLVHGQIACTLTSIQDYYKVNPSSKVMIDSSGLKNIYDLIGSDSLFSVPASSIPNFGLTNHVVWLKVKFIIHTSTQEWIVDIPVSGLHYVDFYEIRNNRVVKHSKGGFMVPRFKKDTPFSNPSCKLTTQNDTCHLYIRVASENAIILPLFVRSASRYIVYEKLIQWWLGIYFGALFIIALFHFGLFVTIRQGIYAWFYTFIFLMALGQITAVYGYLSDWGLTWIELLKPYLHIVNFFSVAAGLAFVRSIIDVKKFSPIFDVIIRIIGIFAFILAFISPLLSFKLSEQMLVFLNIIPMPFIIISASGRALKGYRPALFFLIATFVLITGLIVYNLMYGFALMPYNVFLYYTPNIATLITVVLYAYSIAEHINIIKRERENAREKSIENLNRALQIEKENQNLEKILYQGKKLEAVGRCVSGVAHDMKNYLSPINIYSQVLVHKCQGYDNLKTYAHNLAKAIKPLNDLLLSLLDISKSRRKTLEPLNLHNNLNQIISLLKHSAPVDVSLQVHLSHNNSMILGDKAKIHSIFLNVGVNALDACRNSSGLISITDDVVTLDENSSLLKQFSGSKGKYVKITFEDNGTGMSEETMDHIFEPFYSCNKDGGAGLGMSIVYAGIKYHKGCIEVISSPKQGTKICLYFPIVT